MTLMVEDQTTVEIDQVETQVEDLDAVRTRIRDLKKTETQLVSQIAAAMGGAHIGTIGGEPAIRRDERENTHIMKDAVRALLTSDEFAKVLKVTPYVKTELLGRFRRESKVKRGQAAQ